MPLVCAFVNFVKNDQKGNLCVCKNPIYLMFLKENFLNWSLMGNFQNILNLLVFFYIIKMKIKLTWNTMWSEITENDKILGVYLISLDIQYMTPVQHFKENF